MNPLDERFSLDIIIDDISTEDYLFRLMIDKRKFFQIIKLKKRR